MRRWAVAASLFVASASTVAAQRAPRDSVGRDSVPRPPLPPDVWLGDDKIKHAFLSGFTYAVSYAGARTVGLNRGAGLAVAVVPTALVAVGKEVRDRRVTGRFSLRDLAADAVGAAAYAAVVARTTR